MGEGGGRRVFFFFLNCIFQPFSLASGLPLCHRMHFNFFYSSCCWFFFLDKKKIITNATFTPVCFGQCLSGVIATSGAH